LDTREEAMAEASAVTRFTIKSGHVQTQVTDDVVRVTVKLNAPEEEKSDDELSTPEMALCSDEDRLDELDSEDDRELRAEEAEELDSPELTRELSTRGGQRG